jgi:hypothetical protein
MAHTTLEAKTKEIMVGGQTLTKSSQDPISTNKNLGMEAHTSSM